MIFYSRYCDVIPNAPTTFISHAVIFVHIVITVHISISISLTAKQYNVKQIKSNWFTLHELLLGIKCVSLFFFCVAVILIFCIPDFSKNLREHLKSSRVEQHPPPFPPPSSSILSARHYTSQERIRQQNGVARPWEPKAVRGWWVEWMSPRGIRQAFVATITHTGKI